MFQNTIRNAKPEFGSEFSHLATPFAGILMLINNTEKTQNILEYVSWPIKTLTGPRFPRFFGSSKPHTQPLKHSGILGNLLGLCMISTIFNLNRLIKLLQGQVNPFKIHDWISG